MPPSLPSDPASLELALVARRQELKLTLEDVAEVSGFSVSMLSRWERGESNIPSGQLPGLAKAYRLQVPEIFGDVKLAEHSDILDRLVARIVLNRHADPATSYVARMTAKGRAKIAQKVGEEAVETVIAAMGKDRGELVSEATDLVFHLALLLADAGLSFDDIRTELARREGVSGLAEKAARKP